MLPLGIFVVIAAPLGYLWILRQDSRAEKHEKLGGFLLAVAGLVLLLVTVLYGSVVYGKLHAKAPQKIEGVARVFMHRPGWWTLMVRQADGSLQTMSIDAGDATYIPDVPASEPMWVELRGGNEADGYEFAEFHIRSEKDVEGGEWRSGKTARGQTQVIQ